MKNKSLIIILFIVIAIGAGGMFLLGSSDDGNSAAKNLSTFAVKRGPLTISVMESGTIKARDQEILKSEVEGRVSILYIIDEGTRVKKGELLVELDGSTLVDRKIDQEIRVQNTEATFIRARENLAVAKNRSKSDVDKAKLKFEFAKQDLEKYIKGEYPNELKKAESNIQLAKERVARSEEKLKWSKRLFSEKFISQTELQTDQLAANKDKVDLEIAENNLSLLEDYTKKRRIAQLESDVNQRRVDLEIAEREAISDVVQAEVDLRAKESEHKRQTSKLEKLEEQIVKTKIYAPGEGLVIYATSAKPGWRGNEEPLDEGREVREREELIYLPTTSSSKVEVGIHETSLDKVRIGLPAKITVDALDGKEFSGKVAKIAPLPDAQRRWMNPDLQVYNAEIYLDSSDDSLRTGMTCMAEIIIERYNDTLYIPIQAVIKVDGKPTVYVLNGDKPEPVTIETGLDNNRMIRVISGLDEGQKVLLTPPLSSGEIKEEGETDDKVKSNIAPAPKENTPRENARGETGTGEKQRRQKGTRQGKRDQTKKPDMSNMTEEQKTKMKERFEKMSPQEKEKMQKQMTGGK